MVHPNHRAQRVQSVATLLGVKIDPLPPYSPDFMPVEHLWQWLREDVTDHACYANADELKQRVEPFQHQINADPLAIADRLWVKNHLDPQEEKLRVST